MNRRLPIFFVAVAATGCVTAGLRATLVQRATFELDCPSDRLTVTELGDYRTQGVAGCDRKAVYVLSPQGQWLLNSDAGTPK